MHQWHGYKETFLFSTTVSHRTSWHMFFCLMFERQHIEIEFWLRLSWVFSIPWGKRWYIVRMPMFWRNVVFLVVTPRTTRRHNHGTAVDEEVRLHRTHALPFTNKFAVLSLYVILSTVLYRTDTKYTVIKHCLSLYGGVAKWDVADLYQFSSKVSLVCEVLFMCLN